MAGAEILVRVRAVPWTVNWILKREGDPRTGFLLLLEASQGEGGKDLLWGETAGL